MSGHNLAKTLPPGDRDEAAAFPPDDHSAAALQDMPADLFVGRDQDVPVQPGGADEQQELLPGLAIVIDALGTTIDETQMALGDLKLGKAQNNWTVAEAAAHRLVRLATHVARTITKNRPRETSLQHKE